MAVENDECRQNRHRALADGESAPGMEDESDPVPNQGVPRTFPFLQQQPDHPVRSPGDKLLPGLLAGPPLLMGKQRNQFLVGASLQVQFSARPRGEEEQQEEREQENASHGAWPNGPVFGGPTLLKPSSPATL